MSSTDRGRGFWLSVAPPIPPPGADDMSAQLRTKRVHPQQDIQIDEVPSINSPLEGKDTDVRASWKQEEGCSRSTPKLSLKNELGKIKIPPPTWHRTIDALGRPILHGKFPTKRLPQVSPKRVTHKESDSCSAPHVQTVDLAQIDDDDTSPPLVIQHFSQEKPLLQRNMPSQHVSQGEPVVREVNVDLNKGKVAFAKDTSDETQNTTFGKMPTRPRSLVIRDYPSHPSVTIETYAPSPRALAARRRSLAKQNEASGHSSHLLVEEVLDFTLWESFTNSWCKLWRAISDWNNKRTLKHVAASLHVLRTYHDTLLTGTVPVSLKAKTWMREGILGTFWHLTEFSLAVLSCSLYIYSTYEPSARQNWCFHIQNVISIGFLCDYILRVYTEPVRFYYICSVRGLIDILSVIPIILLFRTVIYGADVIRLLQFVRILRIFSLIQKLGLLGTSVNDQIVLLAIATMGAIIFDAGVLQWLEYFTAAKQVKDKCPVQGCLSFWQSIYFLVVTVSTVGYGDFFPKTQLGQALTCLTIGCALIVIPLRIQKIHSLASRRPYGGSFSTRKIVGSRFLILTGSVTFPGIQSFLSEFFKPTHRQELEIYPLRVIILAPFVPSFDLKQLLSCYDGLAEFIEGSPIRQTDLARVSAHKAMAIFLLADRDAEDKKVEDSAQIVRTLAVHRFCRVNCHDKERSRIIVEVMDPETQQSAVWDEVHPGYVEVICPAKIHYKMMARSCFVKGLYTFITNLFTSELRLKYAPRPHFLTEYFHSFDNEVYPVILPAAFQNLSFEEVAEIIFVKFSSTLFGVDTEVATKSTGRRARKVLLFPKGYLIRHDDVGMVIANDLSIAFAIALYKDNDDDIAPCRKLWESLTTTVNMRRTNTEGIQLLDPTTNRWRRSSIGMEKHRRASLVPIEPFGVEGPLVFPRQDPSQFKLESDLRSAIQSVYTTKEFPDWRDQVTSKVDFEKLADKKDEFKVNEHSKSETGFRFPKGMSLEKAAETLLAWPPLSKDERPHPVVIERREDLIMKNLEERKVSMVAFNVPHILLCCQAGWPANLFYFLGEHRKPRFPNPPIVILFPHDPTAQQWGPVGIFPDVFFVKGSPIYELDLMRGGILHALKVVILADQGIPVDLGGVGLQDSLRYKKRPPAAYTSDVENIVVASNVQRLHGSNAAGVMLVEMQHAEAFHFLQPQYKISFHHFEKKDMRRNKDALVHFGPPYMEGRAVSSTMLGFLLRSTFYNKNAMSIVEQFVQGGFIATEEGLSFDRLRVLDQIPVPPVFANKVYSFLFLSLLQDRGILALGLYRARGTLGAPTSYVLTNPLKDCIVNPDDLVYILA
ncbi:unnamed protein product [Calypogeia fissa]